MTLNTYTRLFMRAAPLFNAPVAAMANSRPFGRVVGRNVAIITYTGRRSGRTISTPVAYRRRGDELEIVANMPAAKTWWRNFTGDGAPLSVRLNGIERVGHAKAGTDATGRVTVRVHLGAPAANSLSSIPGPHCGGAKNSSAMPSGSRKLSPEP